MQRLTLRLGDALPHPWAASPPDYRVIGTVRRGLELGQLAIAPDGQYVQVNGSWVKELNTSQVLAVIRKAVQPHGQAARGRHSRTAHPQSTVLVRKRRRAVVPHEGSVDA